jgi:hypothetical protein
LVFTFVLRTNLQGNTTKHGEMNIESIDEIVRNAERAIVEVAASMESLAKSVKKMEA